MSDKRPNIIFVIADQHNAKVLGCKGHPDVQTPHMDRMAAEGVRFDNAICQNPICTPSRVSWLSGQYCSNHGYYGLSGPNPNGLPSILGHFRRYGYTTLAAGKIHCPEYWVEDDCDEFHETCNCSVEGRSDEYNEFLMERGKLELEDHGRMPEFGVGGGQSVEGRPSRLTFEESQEGWIAAKSCQFIDRAIENGRPFFVHASLPRPHQCTAPSQPFWDLYEGRELTLPPNSDYDVSLKSPAMQQTVARWRSGDWTLIEPKNYEAGRLRKLHGYLGAVSQVDHALGQILDHLEKKGIAQDTTVVYSADHGDYATEHGIMEKAPGICADAITRIPMIWQWKGHFKEGHVVPEIVESVDLANTLCSLAGIDELATADGLEITHLLRGESGEIHKVGITENAFGKSVRKGDWRFVYYPPEMFADEHPDGFGELYNLAEDPWEMNNLYFSPEHQKKVAEMTSDLAEWLITHRRNRTVMPTQRGNRVNHGSQFHRRYHHVTAADGRIAPVQVRTSPAKNYM